MRRISILLSIIGLALPTALAAQLSLPLPTAPVGDVASRVTGGLTGDLLERLPRTDAVNRLADARIARLRELVRARGDSIEIDDAGEPAVRGRLVVTGADAATLDRARADGFGVVAEETVEGLDVQFATLSAPRGMSLTRAIRRLRKLAPNAEVSADPLHEVSGAGYGGAGDTATPLAQASGGGADGVIGLIDGGVARHPALTGAIEQRGFATGAPRPSDHGTAVASLMVGRGAIAGPAGGARLLAADVYGNDPAGGNATAIARALGWLTVSGVRVVAISLVGPRNPLLERVVAAAQKRGVRIVAAVGNDGPAAPPAFPASYPGVIAVTGVDAKNRALIEAGRSLHLDFAAPGADMLAARTSGGAMAVRGTSFATPLVAARLLRLGGDVAALAAQAQDLGRKGPDSVYGRGLVCGECRTPKR